MKKTIAVQPNSFHHKAIEQLMDEIGFREIDRVSTGGYMSPVEIILTFEGDERLYHEDSYIRNQTTDYNSDFVSLRQDGVYQFKTVDEYKANARKKLPLSIQKF